MFIPNWTKTLRDAKILRLFTVGTTTKSEKTPLQRTYVMQRVSITLSMKAGTGLNI